MLLTDVCKNLDLKKARVDLWIVRRAFVPQNETQAGVARQLTKTDAMRLAILKRFAEAGLPLSGDGTNYAFDLGGLYGFKDDTAFLVMWSGLNVEIVPATERGSSGTKVGEGIPARQPGYIRCEIIGGREIVAFLSDPRVEIATIINLDEVERQIDAFWIEAE